MTKFQNLYENATSDMEVMALAYYMINSERPWEIDDINIIADAFGVAIKGFLEVDIKEFLKERGLMEENGQIVEE